MTLPKVLLFPGEKWLSAEMDRDSGSLANHFAPSRALHLQGESNGAE